MTESKLPAKVETKSFWALAPKPQLKRAAAIADIAADFIQKQGLQVKIGKGTHVKNEGWCWLAAQTGIDIFEEYVRAGDDGSYEAKYVAKDQITEKVVGSASGYCGVDEANWNKKDKFSRRSMAQTRAQNKVLKAKLSWILTMKGYSPTPAEDMPGFEGDGETVNTTFDDVPEEPSIELEYNPQIWATYGGFLIDLASNIKDEEIRVKAIDFIGKHNGDDDNLSNIHGSIKEILK